MLAFFFHIILNSLIKWDIFKKKKILFSFFLVKKKKKKRGRGEGPSDAGTLLLSITLVASCMLSIISNYL
jgi:hypothetical protein